MRQKYHFQVCIKTLPGKDAIKIPQKTLKIPQKRLEISIHTIYEANS